MQRFAGFAGVFGRGTSNANKKQKQIANSLIAYFDQKQPKNKNIQPFLLQDFVQFNKAVYDYMVLLRQQEYHDKLSREIKNANTRVTLNMLNNKIKKSPISQNLQLSLQLQLRKRYTNMVRQMLNQNINKNSNLNTHRNILKEFWSLIPQEAKNELSSQYNQRLGKIANMIRRRDILAKNKSKLTQENINFLKSFGNNVTQLDRARQAARPARVKAAALKLWGHAGVGARSNTNIGKRNALITARNNHNLMTNLENLTRSELNNLLNNPSFTPPTNNRGNDRNRHRARVKALMNSLQQLKNPATGV